jgi:hypothetical protein
MSNIKTVFAGISGPAAWLPYPKPEGINQRAFSFIFNNNAPSSHPGITDPEPTWNLIGWYGF